MQTGTSYVVYLIDKLNVYGKCGNNLTDCRWKRSLSKLEIWV